MVISKGYRERYPYNRNDPEGEMEYYSEMVDRLQKRRWNPDTPKDEAERLDKVIHRYETDIKRVRRKLQRGEKHDQENLEGRVSIFILSSLFGITLALSSLKATGNAISNLTGTSQGLIGLILFVIGLAGLVFGKK